MTERDHRHFEINNLTWHTMKPRNEVKIGIYPALFHRSLKTKVGIRLEAFREAFTHPKDEIKHEKQCLHANNIAESFISGLHRFCRR